MAVGKVSDADFESEVLKATGAVVVDFWAEWCGPCRMIAPALEEIAGSLGSKVKIVKLNVDESPQTAQKYGVMSIPTLMLFKNGEMASRQVGAAPKQARAVDHRRHVSRPRLILVGIAGRSPGDFANEVRLLGFRRDRGCSRVPGALRTKCRCAEPGPFQPLAPGTAPAQGPDR